MSAGKGMAPTKGYNHTAYRANYDGIFGHPARNWDQDAENDPDNGAYSRKCCLCGLQFVGHKRRVACRQCSRPLIGGTP